MSHKDTPNEFNVPIARTHLTNGDKKCGRKLDSGWLVQGPKVAKFEEEWCEFTGAKYSIAVTRVLLLFNACWPQDFRR